jgi:hypothetical protein
MIGFNGGLIGKANPTIAAASIPGVWTLREVEVAVRNARWSNAALLDLYPGATAAFSLRPLRGADINTRVVQVRRSSGSPSTADFTAAEVADGTLESWVGAGNNGFVRTWYDQSGNGNDATQATDGVQPRIVTSGVLERDPAVTGRPTIRFGLVTSRLVTPTISFASNCAIFAVTKHTNSASTWSFFFGHTQSGARFYVGKAANSSGSPAVHLKFAGANFETLTGTDMIAKTVSYWQQGTGISQYRLNNGTTTSLTNGSLASNGISIGGPAVDNTDNPWYGPIQEFIYYPNSQVNTYANIMTDINAYYSIY